MPHRRTLAFLGLWLAAATALVHAGALRALPPPFPQLVLAALTAALFAAWALHPGFRAALERLPTGALVALHLSRFVGLYFLVLHGRGALPWAFAVPGGWGDFAVASGALALLAAHRGRPPARARSVQLWNAFGLADILFVVASAARSALADPASMAPLTELPLGLLPAYLVPLILFTHGVLLRRGLARHATRTAPARRKA